MSTSHPETLRQINIGIKGLAKYMTSGEAARRKILFDYKHPDPEGNAQAQYYSEARTTIARLVRGTIDLAAALKHAEDLRVQGNTVEGARGTKLKCNGRAIGQYVRHFGAKEFEWVQPPKLELNYGPVRISTSPDLHVRDGRRGRLIRLEFASDLKPEAAQIIAQGIFESSQAAQLDVTASAVSVWKLADGTTHGGARMGSRMRKNIEAACQNIVAIWPSI
jgi:hypothetical protein